MPKWQLTNDKIMQVKGVTFKGPAITIIAYVTPAGVLCDATWHCDEAVT